MKYHTFNHIVLIGRSKTKGVPETLIALKDHLLSHKINIVIEENTANMLSNNSVKTVPADHLPPETDLIIVVGGDGSMLQAAHTALKHDLPMLGINRGKLGFLTDIHPDEFNKIDEILAGHYFTEQRFLLQAELNQKNEIIHENMALNDVVLLPGDLAHMIEFETYINDQFVCKQRADGLIVATPTGSTAYALSGGGPIMHPQLDAVVLVPMFPHTLSSRPIVVDADSQIEICICDSNEVSPYISNDGQTRVSIAPGGKITIKKHQKSLTLVHPSDYSYFSTLREKLGWERSTQRI